MPALATTTLLVGLAEDVEEEAEIDRDDQRAGRKEPPEFASPPGRGGDVLAVSGGAVGVEGDGELLHFKMPATTPGDVGMFNFCGARVIAGMVHRSIRGLYAPTVHPAVWRLPRSRHQLMK